MNIPIWQQWWVQSLLALGPAVGIPTLAHQFEWTRSIGQDVALAVGVWVVGMIFQIAHSLHGFHVERLEVGRVLEMVDKNDQRLLELQTRYREISARMLNDKPNRVFLDYYHYNLEYVLKVARRAAQHGELVVRDRHHDTVETVLAAFDGCDDRTYRCVWLIEEGEALFDEYWRQYMQSLLPLTRARCYRKRVNVRILFVVDGEPQLERESVKVVLRFLSEEAGFEYRVITVDDYRSRSRDARLDEDCVDFGVYGNHLLFRTISYDPHVGVFSDQPEAIATYRGMHDAAMNAAITLNVPPQPSVSVSVGDFLTCDSLEEGRQR